MKKPKLCLAKRKEGNLFGQSQEPAPLSADAEFSHMIKKNRYHVLVTHLTLLFPPSLRTSLTDSLLLVLPRFRFRRCSLLLLAF